MAIETTTDSRRDKTRRSIAPDEKVDKITIITVIVVRRVSESAHRDLVKRSDEEDGMLPPLDFRDEPSLQPVRRSRLRSRRADSVVSFSQRS